LPEYIENFHLNQKKTFEDYDISLNLFSASCLGKGYEFHKDVSAEFFRAMYQKNAIVKNYSNQFYDTILGKVLNGRQVEGKCPIANCQSETAYADECSLGHQYSPAELIDPVSMLTGTKPELRKVGNYYFELEKYRDKLKQHIRNMEDNPMVRKFMLREMKDFLLAPATYIAFDVVDKNSNFFEKIENVRFERDEKRNQVVYYFNTVNERDSFCEKLNENGIHFKNNKTIAPLRISGNIKWGVPLPVIDGEPETRELTFYVWPESLWAPISFTKQYLDSINSITTWKDWWCSKDCKVIQFIGEDNIYFYTLAQTAMFLSMNSEDNLNAQDGEIQMSTVVAQKHILLNNIKASSSGKMRAPTANELLEKYTKEQLRCYFLSHNINTIASNFQSKAFFPEMYPKCGDPLVAQGNILTNVFNRIVRSVFYTLQQYFDGVLPNKQTGEWIKELSINTLKDYVSKFKSVKFNEIMPILDSYFRAVNLNWAEKSKIDDDEIRAQLIIDTIHAIKTGLLMLHPIAPSGAKLVAEYLNVDNEIWNWDNSEKTFEEIYPNITKFKTIPPKFDFFKKHESQL